nr:ankyrin repeat family protein [Oriental turtle dovepox virus]
MKNIHLNSKYYLDIFVISKNMNLLRRLVDYVKVDYLNQTMFPIYLYEIKKDRNDSGKIRKTRSCISIT